MSVGARGGSWLAGNGVGLVRERELARRVQAGLMRLYRVDGDASPEVDAFIVPAGDGEREGLLVRESDDGVELALLLPELGAAAFNVSTGESLDPFCQIIEGVSHFVYVSHRATEGRSTTQLELELQAEVDKYVILAASVTAMNEATSRTLRRALYERVQYAHDRGSERGARYRLANDNAHRYVRRLEREYLSRCRFGEMQTELRRFYRGGQEDKLRAC